MKLYRVISRESEWSWMHILAEDKKEAIKKYLEIQDDEHYHQQISCKYICDRDSITPTIEPIKEFSK